jgi:hypothetical protein
MRRRRQEVRPQKNVPVSYDPSQPSKCRLQRNVGRLSLSELFFLSAGASFLSFAIAFWFWERECTWSGNERPPSAGYRVSRLGFYLAATLFVLQACWAAWLSGSGGSI